MFVDQNFPEGDLVDILMCPVCHQNLEATLTLAPQAAPGHGLSRGFCKSCGYLGAKRTFSPKWMNNYYMQNWTNSEAVFEAEMTSDLRNSRPFNLMSKYLKDKTSTLLDAGAGYGSSLRVFLESGYKNVEALELSSRRVKVLQSRYQVAVDNIPLESLRHSKILRKKYDGIFLWHVFEHLFNLEQCMESLHDAIEDGGLLYIAIPHFSEEHFVNLLNLHVHMHTFQPFTLHFLMSRYGFQLLEEDTTFDGGGIKAIYRKIGPIEKEGNRKLLPDPFAIANSYNEKVFKDFQLMHLIHQPESARKNVILSFHYYASFAGTCFVKYPTGLIDRTLFNLSVFLADELPQRVGYFFKRVALKIHRFIDLHFKLSLGTFYFGEFSGLPVDPYPFRLIFNTGDIIRLTFLEEGKRAKFWME